MLHFVFKPAQKRASPSEGRILGRRTEPESAKDLRSQAGASGGGKGRGSEQIQVWSKRRGRKPFGPSVRHGREFPERDTEGWNGVAEEEGNFRAGELLKVFFSESFLWNDLATS
jgi:hypothetical protein